MYTSPLAVYARGTIMAFVDYLEAIPDVEQVRGWAPATGRGGGACSRLANAPPVVADRRTCSFFYNQYLNPIQLEALKVAQQALRRQSEPLAAPPNLLAELRREAQHLGVLVDAAAR